MYLCGTQCPKALEREIFANGKNHIVLTCDNFIKEGTFRLKLKELFGPKRGACSVQTARETPMPWYAAGQQWNCRFYDEIRRNIPLIDAAIDKICRLVGGCVPVCQNKAAETALRHFFETVQVGANASGLDSFVRIYLDSLLTYGNAVGEIVLTAAGDDVAGLYIAPLDQIRFMPGADALDLQVCTLKNGMTPVPVKYPQLVLPCALFPKPGELAGNSLLAGLPFVSDILLKIYSSIGQNFERIANLRYAVTYKPETGTLDRMHAREIAENMAGQWAEVMQPGQIRDFVAVGDIDIKVIGADSQMIDTQIPVRQMLEQIVAKLAVPPFLLGLSWSTTERMSSQQADILTSELEAYRRLLNPVLLKICNMFMRLRGFGGEAEIVWDNINLQDELELANARLINLQADQLEQEGV